MSDRLITLAGWGSCELSCPDDANDDDVGNVEDILSIISTWGDCPE